MRSILACFLAVTCLVTPLAAQELTGTLQQIQKSGKIKIGYRASVPPLSFLNKDGAPVGYSIDLCKAIAEAAKQKGVSKVAFDRGGYQFHGRVAALAEEARKNGLEF